MVQRHMLVFKTRSNENQRMDMCKEWNKYNVLSILAEIKQVSGVK